jgi:hypothetical protein
MNLLLSSLTLFLKGNPLPYSPRHDDVIVVLLFACFFLSAYVLARGSKLLLLLLKDFLLHRERISIFAASGVNGTRYFFLLIVQLCLLSALCCYVYLADLHPELMTDGSSFFFITIYALLFALYLLVKRILYVFVGWVFIEGNKIELWITSYATLLYYSGLLLFPLTLCFVYFQIPLLITVIFLVSLFIIAKILIFYKWIKLFCSNIVQCVVLILYFCALEIVPCIILYKGIVELNDCLNVNL